MAHQDVAPAMIQRKHQEAPLSLRSYVLQGSVWMGVLVGLLFTAGFRF